MYDPKPFRTLKDLREKYKSYILQRLDLEGHEHRKFIVEEALNRMCDEWLELEDYSIGGDDG